MNPYETQFDAVIATPVGKLGLKIDDNALTELHFLEEDATPFAHENTTEIVAEINKYFKNSKHSFSINLNIKGTPFQQRVWRALCEIPHGTTVTYGTLARQLDSSPRAVGQACRDNPTPVVVPCHRVTSSHGMGGYCGATDGNLVAIKDWLVQHEG